MYSIDATAKRVYSHRKMFHDGTPRNLGLNQHHVVVQHEDGAMPTCGARGGHHLSRANGLVRSRPCARCDVRARQRRRTQVRDGSFPSWMAPITQGTSPINKSFVTLMMSVDPERLMVVFYAYDNGIERKSGPQRPYWKGVIPKHSWCLRSTLNACRSPTVRTSHVKTLRLASGLW
jgi:hypothetical protein